MIVGAARIELFISDSNSLKHKRTVIKALKDRIRNNFNVSVSEVDEHDKWQKAVVAIAAVGPDKRYINGLLDRVLEFLRQNPKIQILDYHMEMT